jgi:GWxTD domain-containing protein
MGKTDPAAGEGDGKKKLINFIRMGRRRFWLIGVVVLMALVAGCTSTKETTTEETPGYLASLYNPSRLSLHPDYSIFHQGDDFSQLYIRAYPSELRFDEANEDAEYRALLMFKYQLIHLEEKGLDGAVVDSATVTFKLGATEEKRSAFFATLSIPVKQGFQYLLRLEARDLNRGSIGLEYLFVDKTNRDGAQNFKVISAYSGYPKFMRFFLPGERFNVQYRDLSVDSIYVEYFKLESELPRPPITASADYTLKYTPDTVFIFPLVDTADYDLRREGMYYIKVNKMRDQGLTLFNFGGSFPEVKTPEELMEPLFYLTTMAEYRDLRKQPNRKLAVDDFWLKTGNNMERSRELIRIYYNRVVYSNLYFTTNKEGWKTDQGMIFILFGPPARIQMTGTGERWYYYSKRGGKTVEFKFDRQPDNFTHQHLVWMKTTDSQMYWNEAVRSWRNGKVYSMGS